uniref:Uncharacterized protein n=1 Tax=Arundo donax TaxID=35708 RepID=A0A0A9EU64_ARUDO
MYLWLKFHRFLSSFEPDSSFGACCPKELLVLLFYMFFSYQTTIAKVRPSSSNREFWFCVCPRVGPRAPEVRSQLLVVRLPELRKITLGARQTCRHRQYPRKQKHSPAPNTIQSGWRARPPQSDARTGGRGSDPAPHRRPHARPGCPGLAPDTFSMASRAVQSTPRAGAHDGRTTHPPRRAVPAGGHAESRCAVRPSHWRPNPACLACRCTAMWSASPPLPSPPLPTCIIVTSCCYSSSPSSSAAFFSSYIGSSCYIYGCHWSAAHSVQPLLASYLSQQEIP